MSETTPMQPGGVIAGPRFQREHAREHPSEALKRVGGTVEEYHREKVSEARVLGFAGGVVVGVAWMLLVLFVADRLA